MTQTNQTLREYVDELLQAEIEDKAYHQVFEKEHATGKDGRLVYTMKPDTTWSVVKHNQLFIYTQ